MADLLGESMNIQEFSAKYRLRIAKDEDGLEIVPGLKGESHIYDHEDGQHLGVCFMPLKRRSTPLNYASATRAWKLARTELLEAGGALGQDGDFEGTVLFDPKDAKQAKVAIHSIKARQKRVYTEEQRKQMSERLEAFKFRK